MKPHKHAELIKAWADGAEIEFYSEHFKRWVIADRNAIHWHPNYEYRLFKPEPKPDVVKVFALESNPFAGLRMSDVTDLPYGGEQRIRCNFDGETGELKSAEVLK